jgi:hypothetical protein
VQGWCERLIDIDESDATPFHFRPVLTKGPTLAELYPAHAHARTLTHARARTQSVPSLLYSLLYS